MKFKVEEIEGGFLVDDNVKIAFVSNEFDVVIYEGTGMMGEHSIIGLIESAKKQSNRR